MTKEEFEKNCWAVSDVAYDGIEALRKEVYGISDEEFYASYKTGMKDNPIVLELTKRINALKQAEANAISKLSEVAYNAAKEILRKANYHNDEILKLIAIDLVGIETVARIDLENNYRLSKDETDYILSQL